MKNEDIRFMSNLSAAVLQKNSRKSSLLVTLLMVCVAWVLFWAYHAEIDEYTRGTGQVVPYSKLKVIQNLEGGIISSIMVKTGEFVKKGDPLIKIENIKFESILEESKIALNSLRAKSAMLTAETNNTKFKVSEELQAADPTLVTNTQNLFNSHMGYLDNQIKIVKNQIAHRKIEISDFISRLKYIVSNKALLVKQIKLTRPLVEKGIESLTNFIKLERELIGINEKIAGSKFAVKKSNSAIKELKNKITELKMSFKNRAQKDLNQALSEISQFEEKRHAFKDQVTRTLIISPVEGIVKQMFVNTIGGVVKPGMNIMEIVPLDDKLMVEAKIKPSDIAFIHPGQKATVKVTAYDYSIHGGLDGKLVSISADTITTPRGESYFLVNILTDKNYLGTMEKPKKIIPGMTVSIDLLTGKKTVMDFLLKPILKVKQNSFTER